MLPSDPKNGKVVLNSKTELETPTMTQEEVVDPLAKKRTPKMMKVTTYNIPTESSKTKTMTMTHWP